MFYMYGEFLQSSVQSLFLLTLASLPLAHMESITVNSKGIKI